jgi:hypothetical protein
MALPLQLILAAMMAWDGDSYGRIVYKYSLICGTWDKKTITSYDYVLAVFL